MSSGSRTARILGPNTGLRESETVELKESNVEDALYTICAFANTSGGTVYLGIADNGCVVDGFDASDSAQRGVTQKVRNVLNLEVSVTVESAEGHPYLVVKVERKKKPIYLRGAYYHRSGTETVQVKDHDEITKLILSQTGQKWDGLSADVLLTEGIDRHRLESFVRTAMEQKVVRLSPEVDPSHSTALILEHIDEALIVDKTASYGAVLAFGANVQSIVRHARIQILGVKPGDVYEEYPECQGTILEQIDTAVSTIMAANPVYISFDRAGGAQGGTVNRKEIPQYHPWAIKEAVANAVIHRDYTVSGAEVSIRMYPDRIVITNPGGLPAGVTLEMLGEKPHPSVKRNPLLAKVCYVAHYAERYGSGTTRMIERCREWTLPDPVFDLQGGFFRATLFKHPLHPDLLAAVPLNQRQGLAVQHVREHQRLDSAGYAQLAGSTKPTRARDLDDLVERGLFVKVGSRGPGVYWRARMPNEN